MIDLGTFKMVSHRRSVSHRSGLTSQVSLYLISCVLQHNCVTFSPFTFTFILLLKVVLVMDLKRIIINASCQDVQTHTMHLNTGMCFNPVYICVVGIYCSFSKPLVRCLGNQSGAMEPRGNLQVYPNFCLGLCLSVVSITLMVMSYYVIIIMYPVLACTLEAFQSSGTCVEVHLTLG